MRVTMIAGLEGARRGESTGERNSRAILVKSRRQKRALSVQFINRRPLRYLLSVSWMAAPVEARMLLPPHATPSAKVGDFVFGAARLPGRFRRNARRKSSGATRREISLRENRIQPPERHLPKPAADPQQRWQLPNLGRTGNLPGDERPVAGVVALQTARDGAHRQSARNHLRVSRRWAAVPGHLPPII